MNRRIELTDQPIDTLAMEKWLSDPSCGALVFFRGTVRHHHEGKEVLALEYSAYAEMAVKTLQEVADEVEKRWPIAKLLICHRIGKLLPENISILIGVASRHRTDAFSACQYAIDNIKERVPIWKREQYRNSSQWVGLPCDSADHSELRS